MPDIFNKQELKDRVGEILTRGEDVVPIFFSGFQGNYEVGAHAKDTKDHIAGIYGKGKVTLPANGFKTLDARNVRGFWIIAIVNRDSMTQEAIDLYDPEERDPDFCVPMKVWPYKLAPKKVKAVIGPQDDADWVMEVPKDDVYSAYHDNPPSWANEGFPFGCSAVIRIVGKNDIYYVGKMHESRKE